MTVRWLLPLALAGAVLAQQPRQPQMQPQMQTQPSSRALRQYLSLTDAQVQKMHEASEAASRQAAEKEKTIRPQLEQKRAALHELMSKSSPDAAAVGKAMIELQGLEKQILQAHESARNSFVEVLTPEQKTRFKAVMDAALLPQAAREAVALGLVPGAPPQPQPMPGAQMRGQGMMHGRGRGGPGPHMMGPGPGQSGPGQFRPNQGQPQPPNPPRSNL